MSLLDKVLCDTAKELGCKPDNEEILFAIKAQADKLAKLTAALQQISDMGPMSVDDQRWRIAREALGIKQNAPSV